MIRTLLLLSVFLLAPAFATRPQLVDQRLWFVDQTILNVDYQVAVAQMDFDQDLYLNGATFLCGLAEEPCPDTNCVPCDWSSQNPSGCDDVQCCGPAQTGGDAWAQVNDWCEPPPSAPPYHTLKPNERSEIFTVEPGETLYFRFFLSSEFACKPFRLLVRPYYGVPSVFLSNLFAVPSTENADWRKGYVPPAWGWGQNDIVVCPNSHDDYRLGTYSLGVFSWYSSSFDIEIIVSPQEYPLVPPPGRILCADVPESEITGAQAGGNDLAFCLQDTETLTLDYDQSFQGTTNQFVLPIPPGCHHVSFTTTVPRTKVEAAPHCLPKDINSPLFLTNSLMTRWSLQDARLSFSVCSDVVSYVRCATTWFIPGLTHTIFSTVAIPLSIPLAPNANTPAASFSYQDALNALAPAVYGERKVVCGGFFPGFCGDWMVPSLVDPLIFWPPSPQLPKLDTEGINVYGEYYNATDAQPLERSLTIVIVMKSGPTEFFSRDQLDQMSLSVLFVTNELGESPELIDNSFDANEKTSASPSQYLPTISLSSFTQLDLSELCNQSSYNKLQHVVDNELARILESDSLQTIEFHKYVLDLVNAGIAGSSCLEAAIKAMNTQVEKVTLVDQISCPYEPATQEYADDVCCNSSLSVIECCAPFTLVQEQEQFTTANSSMCGVPECAETYFEDLAQSLNHVDDLIQGCSSGVEVIENAFGKLIEKQKVVVIRDCLNEVGLRDDFEGIDCVADFQCEQWFGRCNHQTKKCVLGKTTSEVEDDYLQCYISRMSSSLEEYLRLNVLPADTASAPSDSEIFFLGLKSASLVNDCVATNEPLDIFLRSWYVWDGTIACKADVLGLPEDDADAVNAICPPGHCLGTSCKQSAAQCYTRCEVHYVFHPSSESECSASSTVCPVSGLPAGDNCEGNYCVYCPGGEDEECIYVPGDQDYCENTVACELENGEVVFGLTEGECAAQTGYCSNDCPGESCRSLDGLYGACLATVSSETLCLDFNSISGVDAVWYEDICIVSSESLSCTELSSEIGVPTNWETCESLDITSCNGDDTFQQYLKCFVDLWHRCESQEECQNSGHCTDRPWTTTVRSDQHPIDVQFGSCFISGYHLAANLDPYCRSGSTNRPGIGCRDFTVLTEAECPPVGDETWQAWLTPAMSETECRNQNDGRYGCQKPEIITNLFWFNEENCDCAGGVNDYAWEWTGGVWNTGVSRTLHWREVQPVLKYQWTPALSFELLQTWLEENEEQRFSFAIKSEVICENGYVSSSLNTLVCDCFSNSDETSDCYNQTGDQVEELVGVTGACASETSFVKGPSSRVSFGLDSIGTGCTFVNLSIVSEAWFVVPPPRPSISFTFEEKPKTGIVLNQKSATVGVLRGDGSVLHFSKLESAKSFSACLLVDENQTDISQKYPVLDFGYSKEPIGTIYPLGISNLNSTLVVSSQFLCGNVTIADFPVIDGNAIRLYPISRIEDYEKEENEYTSRQTRALMYTLGVCYCVCFALLFFYFVNFLRNTSKSQMLGIISLLLLLLCVFRAVFMFGYPNAIFDDNELAEFVVFEIPTFLLFSVVIVSIYFWKKLSTKKKFFGGDSDNLRMAIALGLVFVWSLWLIVTIIYSEVILEEGGESSCPGRVAPSYDKQEEDTRTLTIVYQSLIITVTFFLAALFCYYSLNLLRLSKNVSKAKRFVMAIGGILVFTFFVRSILLIIVLAAEFTSSVYMFITLMITEVFLLFFLQLQFNSPTVRYLMSSSESRSSHRSSVRTSSPQQ